MELTDKPKRDARFKYLKKEYKRREHDKIERFDKTNCIYVIFTGLFDEEGNEILKFGYTDNLKRRISEHRRTFKECILIFIWPIKDNIKAEKEIKRDFGVNGKNLITKINVNGVNQTELICCYSSDELFEIKDYITKIIKDIQNNDIDYLKSQNVILTNKINSCEQLIKLKDANNSEYKELKDKCANLENECKEIKNNLSQITQILLTLNDKIVYMS